MATFLHKLIFHRKEKKYPPRLPSLKFRKPFDIMCKNYPLNEAGILLKEQTKYKKEV